MITVKNNYGESIRIKIVDKTIMVWHEDATDSYISLNELFQDYILNAEEVSLIYNTIRTIKIETLVSEIFKDLLPKKPNL